MIVERNPRLLRRLEETIGTGDLGVAEIGQIAGVIVMAHGEDIGRFRITGIDKNGRRVIEQRAGAPGAIGVFLEDLVAGIEKYRAQPFALGGLNDVLQGMNGPRLQAHAAPIDGAMRAMGRRDGDTWRAASFHR